MITELLLFLSILTTLIIFGLFYFHLKGFELIKELEDKIFFSIIVIPFISVIISGIFMLFIRIIDVKRTVSYKTTCYITSLRSDNVLNGDFMLGCGNIGETEFYFYFYETLNGGYARDRIDVNQTTIIENDLEIPHIEVLTTHYESIYGFIKYEDYINGDYKIIVPKGTIVNKYNLLWNQYINSIMEMELCYA